jgi:hypothetical protein
MKIYAHYDATGAIRSFVAFDAPKGAGLMLAPKPGHLVAEVEGVKLKAGALDPEALRELATTHKVAEPAARCTLTKKRG